MFGLPLTASSLVVALLSGVGAWLMTRRAFLDCEQPLGSWGRWSLLVAGVLGALLVFTMQGWQSQQTPDVVPSPFWRDARVLFHACLIVLLVAATAIDLHCYLIPDSITLTGMVIALLAATIAGDLQMAHVWVDWNAEVPQLQGPFRPAWLSTHPHLHGLAWSATGLIVGGGLTWLVRSIASAMLRMEALGLGDVMLVAMIGSFLGWQATVVAFLLAPLCAVSVGITARTLGNRGYIPYGPFLALGAMIVVFTWRWIWMGEIPLHPGALPGDRQGVFAVRRLFGDWLSLVVIAAVAVAGLVLLLGLRQLYQAIPVTRHRGDKPRSSAPDQESPRR